MKNQFGLRVWTVAWKSAVVLLAVLFAASVAIGAVSGAIAYKEKPGIYPSDGSLAVEDGAGYDCILVFGCGIKEDNTPTDMLRDRLLVGIALYMASVAPKLLFSGDHGREDYDEVSVMKQFAVEKGVPEEDIFLDHAGFSTYESVYRAKHIFGVEQAVLVTQEYHLPRALYLSEKLGIRAVGVSASLTEYRGQTYRNLRETLARFKDFFFALIQPEPAALGDPIAIDGDGRVTDGEGKDG